MPLSTILIFDFWSYSDSVVIWSYSDSVVIWSYSDSVIFWGYSDSVVIWRYSDSVVIWSYSDIVVFLELFRQCGIFGAIPTVWYFWSYSDSVVFLLWFSFCYTLQKEHVLCTSLICIKRDLKHCVPRQTYNCLWFIHGSHIF